MVCARRLDLPLLVLMCACFEKPKPNCAFLCGAQGACPTDYRCGGDSRCHLLVNGSPQACDDTLPLDASLVDAAQPDAPQPDAMVDATVNMAPTLSTAPV